MYQYVSFARKWQMMVSPFSHSSPLHTHTHTSQNETELKQILYLNLFWVMDLTENMKTRILSLEGKTSV